MLGKVPARQETHELDAEVRKETEQDRQKVREDGAGMCLWRFRLPFTGAWTGSLVASALGMPFKDAVLAIGLGVLIAGVIVTCLCLLGWLGAADSGLRTFQSGDVGNMAGVVVIERR